MIDAVLEDYIATYRRLIVTERLEESIVLSFPFHLAANHRIEITVSEVGGTDTCIISDAARTLGEIEAAGYSLSPQMKEKLEQLAIASGLKIIDGYLVLECPREQIGVSIQRFLEVCKTIGDVYLIHKQRETGDEELISEVSATLNSGGIHYQLHQKIPGQIEDHSFDLVVPDNGRPGMAVKVLGGQNTHGLAQIWGFKCEDIKRGAWGKTQSKIALIYDVRYRRWSDASKAILQSRADIALPSDSIAKLPEILKN